MNNQDILSLVQEKANKWLEGNYDQETKDKVQNLIDNDEAELTESFYKDLEFGTGGLRGIMGVGSNRMNKYTVGMATQGLSNYILKEFSDLKEIKVAIAYDCRNNSRFFAETAANIFSANGFKVYLFEDLRPTPELSYAIRELGCQSGIVLTASHNPKEYNGFKAYWDDGAQIIAPHDTNIINEVQKITDPSEVKFDGVKENIHTLGEDFDNKYIAQIKKLSLSPDAVKANSDMKIVFTPIHGTGVKLIPQALKEYGFTNIINIPEQDVVDGNFPTVVSPNPEEAEALTMAINKAKEVDAELVMASDPDADRVGIAVKDLDGEFVLLNGNQTAAIYTYYMLAKWKENNLIKGNEYIVTTIVTTEILRDIAKHFDVECYEVLTGFKYIASVIRENEGKKTYICGCEESYGYLPGDFVRDKDAVAACALLAEATAWAKSNGKSLYELMIDIYHEFGLYKENLKSIVRKGKSGAEEIQAIMDNFRSNPPKIINGQKLVEIKDYLSLKSLNLLDKTETDIDLPKSNVLQFFLEDGTRISVRPSGTEPKIKFYFGVKEEFENRDDFAKTEKLLDAKIEAIQKDLNI